MSKVKKIENQDNQKMSEKVKLMISYMELKCSLLQGAENDSAEEGGLYSKHPVDTTLAEIFTRITTDNRIKRYTLEYRQHKKVGKTREADNCKRKMLDCFLPSALVKDGTGKECCVGYTNIVMDDYDHLSHEEVERCRELLSADPHCLMFYESVGGHGFHILVPVMGVHDEQTHKIAWEQVSQYYDTLLGIRHDPNCKDLTRRSILAHDPKAFSNPEAIPIYIDYATLVQDRKRGRPLKNARHTLKEVGKELNRYLKARNLQYVDGNRNNYIFNASCQLNRYGVDMDEVLEYFYVEAKDMTGSEIRQTVTSAYKRFADQHGTMSPYSKKEMQEKNKKQKVDVQDVEDYLRSLAEYRYNLISQRYQLRWADETEWCDLTDSILNDLWRKTSKDLCKWKSQELRHIIESSFSTPFNPLKQAFEALTPWDGVTDHIGVIANMVHVRPGHEQYFPFKEALTKWVVGVVASICEERAFNKKILTLVGKQNTFKTSILRMLALPAWGPGAVHTKSSFREFTKDEQLTMTQSPIFCLDEISHLSSSFLDELKSATSQDTINERRPYAHYKESRPRISSFCATGNYVNFLTDSTGNNRFLVFQIESIDSPYENTMNVEGLWSQAYQMYLNKYKYWFSHDEDQLIDKQNELYEVPSAEEDLISTYYQIPQPGEPYKIMNATNIIEHISISYKGKLSQRKICQVLRKLGFQDKHTSTQRGFMVKEIPPADIPMRQQSSDWSHLPPPKPESEPETTAPTLF